MRKRTLGAVLLAGLAVSGTGAFTASNTYNNGSDQTIAGYGASTATGATIEKLAYTPLTADPSKLSSVVFTSSTDVTGKTAKMTLRTASGVVGSAYTCTSGTYTPYVAAVGPVPASGGQTITCTTSDNPVIDSFTSVGLTVTQ